MSSITIIEPKIVYSGKSSINGTVEVYQYGDTYKLLVNGHGQSISGKSPRAKLMLFGQLVDLVKKQKPKAKKFLILGLGGGAIQYLLTQSYKSCEIVSIEIDKLIVDLARKYFEINEIKNHKVITEDAIKVVENPQKYNLSKNYFDVVIVDIFIGGEFVESANIDDFLERLHRLLKSNGLIVFNRTYTEKYKHKALKYFEKVKTVFTNVKFEEIDWLRKAQNILIFGSK